MWQMETTDYRRWLEFLAEFDIGYVAGEHPNGPHVKGQFISICPRLNHSDGHDDAMTIIEFNEDGSFLKYGAWA